MTGYRTRRTRLARALLIAALLTASSPVCAQISGEAAYDLPAQPLGSALTALAQQARVEVIAPAELVEGRSAPALHGRHTPAEALALLLQGSGLVAEQVGEAFVVRRAGDARETAMRGGSEIVVTGSRIRGAVLASPVIVLGEEAMRSAGHASLPDALRAVPQNFGGGQNPGIGNNVPEASGADIGGGASINLRGIGSDATLTLLNGHRLPYSAAAQSIDISAIPLDAVERIEIVADGASALYGSDAVAGVANVILKREFDGARTSARLGASTDGGNMQQQYGLITGRAWTSGGLLAAYEFSRSTRIRAGQRSYAAEATPGVTLYPFLKSHNVLVTGHQALAPGLTFRLDALYNRRWKKSEFPLNFAGDLDVSRAENNTSASSFAIAPSLEAELGGNWHGELSGHYGKSKVHFGADSYYGDLVIDGGDNCYCNEGRGIELGGEGPLFALPGGSARLALGAGWRDNALVRTSPLAPTRALRAAQDSHYGYLELTLPFAAPGQDIAGLHLLSLNAALRYERYPGIDEVVTPKLGLVYAPVRGLTLKASWGKSFRAPTLIQLHQTRSAALAYAQSLGGSGYPASASVLLLDGGSTSLKPERATSWSATAVLEPEPVPGLRLEISAFGIRYRDRIVTPILFVSQALSDPAFADLIARAPSASQIEAALGSADQFANLTGAPFDPASVVAIIDNRYVNAARQTIEGVDILAAYQAGLGAGTLDLSANASLIESRQQRGPGQGDTDLAGTLFNPPHWRARAGGVWTQGPFSLSAALNFTGGVTDRRFADETWVSGMTTFDLALRYRPQSGWARGLDLLLALQNAFNAKPDPIRTTLFYDTPYDSTNYSPMGRFVSLTVARTW